MRSTRIVSSMSLVGLLALAGCATAPSTPSDRQELKDEATEALKEMRAVDPGLGEFLGKAHGYVVFPHVGKGGFIAGGGYGRGIVYKQGATIGYADITQLSVGLQIGGQAYMEVLAFEGPGDLARFTAGRLTLTANLSAVILKSGAAEQARFSDGVAVFVKPTGGAMAEASVGGQQFSFVPE